MSEHTNNLPAPEDLTFSALQEWTNRHNAFSAELLRPETRQVSDLFDAYSYLDALLSEKAEFGEETVKNLHAIAAKSIPHIHPYVGKYYPFPRKIESTLPWELKPFVPVKERPEAMKQLGEDYAQFMKDGYDREGGSIAAIERAAEIITRVSDIHPFFDGNGRVSRIMADGIFLKAGLFQVPYWIPEGDIFKEGNRNAYYRLVEDARIGNPLPLREFLAHQQVISLGHVVSHVFLNPVALTQARALGKFDRFNYQLEEIKQYTSNIKSVQV